MNQRHRQTAFFNRSLFGASVLLFPMAVHAFAPPDFIFNVGSQIAQFFSFLVIGLSMLAGVFRKYFLLHPFYVRHKRLVLTLGALGIVGVSLVGANIYGSYRQRQAYEEWLAESRVRESLAVGTIATELAFDIDDVQTNANIEPNTNARLPEIEKRADVGVPFVRVSDEFFDANAAATPVMISIDEFKQVVESGEEIYVLDAREDEEVENGSFPGSTHIRLADLRVSRWDEIPNDRVVYVFCWSGIRSEEVAEFLRGKKILARAVEAGAFGWVDADGKWDGSISILSKYPQPEYRRVLTLDELLEYQSRGITLIDSRPGSKYNAWHIEGSANIPVIYTPTDRLNKLLDAVPDGPVITICDDVIGCFDAMITGMKLAKRGHQFIGRYTKPWEYQERFDSSDADVDADTNSE